jgi:lysophospholipase L1-like esterase
MFKKLFLPSLILNIVLLLVIILFFAYFPVMKERAIRQKIGLHQERRVQMFEAMPNDSAEIIFLGADLIEGANWSELLENPHIKNRGVYAQKLVDMRRRLPEALAAKPVKIFIAAGYPDLVAGMSPDMVTKEYAALLQAIRKKLPKVRLYIHSLTPILSNLSRDRDKVKTEHILILNGKLKDLAQKFETYYIDLFGSLVGSQETNEIDPKYSDDGIHLSAAAYTRWKALIEQYVKE